MTSPNDRRSLSTGHRNHRILICVLLALITLAVYWPVANHSFINLDDNGYVEFNDHVHQLNMDTVHWAFTTFTESNWHPLTWLSHALDCEIYGIKNPGGHHVTGLIFHLLNVLLVFFVLSRMTGFPWRSAFVAALFAIHPLHVESVAWVAERKDVLSTFFWLLTMLAYVYYTESPKVGRYILVVVAFALGLMAKPMLVTLPLVLLIMDYWPLGRFKAQAGKAAVSPGKLVLEKAPLLAMTLASCVVTFIAQLPKAVASLERFTVGVRIANAIVAYAAYLKKMVWPADLSVFYGHPGKTLPPELVIGSAVLLIALSAAVVLFGRKRPYIIAGWLWYVITLIPVIGLVQVGNQAMADRYTYVPLLGIFIIIAWGIPELFPRSETAAISRQARRAAKRQKDHADAALRLDLAIPAVIVCAILMAVTYTQASYWKDTRTLFAHTTRLFPKDASAHILVAQELDSKAQQLFEKAKSTGVSIDDEVEIGRMRDEAIEEYRKALDITPNNGDAQFNLGVLLTKQKQPAEAIRKFRAALRINPKNANAHAYLGNLLTQNNRLDEATYHLNEAIRLAPDNPQPYCYMGLVLHHKNRIKESEQWYRKSISMKPDYAEAHWNLAIILYIERQYADSWNHVHLSQRYGGTVKQELIDALTQQMPEPAE
jgi:tetratricopeptide (TPR) repeat protein